MILSSDKSPAPAIHVQVPPAIHVHASEVNPTINVHPAELRQEIIVQPADVKNEIVVQPPKIEMPDYERKPCTWKFIIHRDEMGRFASMDAIPQMQ